MNVGASDKTFCAADRASTNVKANGSLPITMVSGILHGFNNVAKGSIKVVTSETLGKSGSRQRLPNLHCRPAAARSLFNEAKDMTRSERSRGLNHNFKPVLQKMSTIRWNTMGDHLKRLDKKSNYNKLSLIRRHWINNNKVKGEEK